MCRFFPKQASTLTMNSVNANKNRGSQRTSVIMIDRFTSTLSLGSVGPSFCLAASVVVATYMLGHAVAFHFQPHRHFPISSPACSCWIENSKPAFPSKRTRRPATIGRGCFWFPSKPVELRSSRSASVDSEVNSSAFRDQRINRRYNGTMGTSYNTSNGQESVVPFLGQRNNTQLERVSLRSKTPARVLSEGMISGKRNGATTTNEKSLPLVKNRMTNIDLERLTNHYCDDVALGELCPVDVHNMTRLASAWTKKKDYLSSTLKPEQASGSKSDWTYRGPRMAERLLKRVVRETDYVLRKRGERARRDVLARPTVNLFSMAISAWARAHIWSAEYGDGGKNNRRGGCRRDGAMKASKLLDLMESRYANGDVSGGKLPMMCYGTVIDAFSRDKSTGSAQRAEDILRRLVARNQAGDVHVAADGGKRSLGLRMFYNVLNSWANAGGKECGPKAEGVLSWMLKLHAEGGDYESLNPDVSCYNIVIKAWARTMQRGGVERAEHILRSLEDGEVENVQPDRISFTTVLLAYAERGDRRLAAYKGEEILKRMQRLYQNGNPLVSPDTVTYNTVIHLLSKSDEADAGERSEELLRVMDQIHERGNDMVKPNTITFNSILNAWASNADKNSPRRAQRLLERMENLHKGGAKHIRPDTVSYNSVITAWARSGAPGSAQRAEDILDRMSEAACSDVRPDRVTYNSVIIAWANSGEMFAAQKAEELLQRMRHLHEAGDKALRPDVTTYNSVINAWSKTGESGAANKADSILQEMIELYQEGDKLLKPDERSFATVMNAWSKSNEPYKAHKTQKILQHLEESYRIDRSNVKPTVFAYGIVLNACAFTTGTSNEKESALEIALATMSKLQNSEHAKPNHVVYGSFLKVCAKLIPAYDARRKLLVEHIFKRCCRDGQVGATVLANMKMAAPPDLYGELLGKYASDGFVHVDDIPTKWRCNVKENRFRIPGRRGKSWRDRW